VIVGVSDTSPVRALANLGLLGLLREIYTEVIVPPAVEKELLTPPDDQAPVTLNGLSFIKIRAPSDDSGVDRFLGILDPGESEALALALEISADLVLIDEADGRASARRAGLDTIGVLGILREAKQRGMIPSLAPLLDELRDRHRFFLSTRLREEVLRSVGETS
jgi:predicted nucleic acid-binding protein